MGGCAASSLCAEAGKRVPSRRTEIQTTLPKFHTLAFRRNTDAQDMYYLHTPRA
jgi:hypothetical protein